MTTEQIDRTSVDKSTWGDGPWQHEPDRVEWEHAGLPCLALRSPRMGNWCGYVAVPPGHPAHGKDYNDVEVDVHGGLTYADSCDGGRICHVPKPGESADVWWLGFDCGHSGDVSPAMHRTLRTSEAYARSGFPESYKTIEYVTSETNALAEQLATLQSVRSRHDSDEDDREDLDGL